MNTEKEGVFTVCNDRGELVAILRKDPRSKKNLVYRCEEASLEDIERLLKGNKAEAAIPANKKP